MVHFTGNVESDRIEELVRLIKEKITGPFFDCFEGEFVMIEDNRLWFKIKPKYKNLWRDGLEIVECVNFELYPDATDEEIKESIEENLREMILDLGYYPYDCFLNEIRSSSDSLELKFTHIDCRNLTFLNLGKGKFSLEIGIELSIAIDGKEVIIREAN